MSSLLLFRSLCARRSPPLETALSDLQPLDSMCFAKILNPAAIFLLLRIAVLGLHDVHRRSGPSRAAPGRAHCRRDCGLLPRNRSDTFTGPFLILPPRLLLQPISRNGPSRDFVMLFRETCCFEHCPESRCSFFPCPALCPAIRSTACAHAAITHYRLTGCRRLPRQPHLARHLRLARHPPPLLTHHAHPTTRFRLTGTQGLAP